MEENACKSININDCGPDFEFGINGYISKLIS